MTQNKPCNIQLSLLLIGIGSTIAVWASKRGKDEQEKGRNKDGDATFFVKHPTLIYIHTFSSCFYIQRRRNGGAGGLRHQKVVGRVFVGNFRHGCHLTICCWLTGHWSTCHGLAGHRLGALVVDGLLKGSLVTVGLLGIISLMVRSLGTGSLDIIGLLGIG